MTAALAVVGNAPVSVFDLGVQLSMVLNEVAQESTGGELSDAARERVADLVEGRTLGKLWRLNGRAISFGPARRSLVD